MKIPKSSAVAAMTLLTCLSAIDVGAGTRYTQTNLVSDLPGVATHVDVNLINPWGIASSASSPIWVAANGTGLSTLYNGAGTPQALVVTIPGSGTGAPGAPTGVAFNGTADFGGAHFIFATEGGTIDAWTSGTSAAVVVDNTATGAVYKGLAIGNNGSGNFLYATNFHAGTVDVFDATYAPATLAGNFIDPGIPAGYAPFGIQNIGGTLYVTYALQDIAKHDDVPGAGHGYVDKFDLNGNFIGRLVSNGPLNSPWGLALAPSDFGDLGNALLVGNFGDGTINGFNAASGAVAGTMLDPGGAQIVVQGLWGLLFGNGGNGGATNALYFTAGITGSGAIEDHGLFGDFTPVAEPSLPVPALNGWALAMLVLVLSAAYLVRRRTIGGH